MEKATIKIHFPKGEGIKIIKASSEASVNDSIYILPIDRQYAEMIVIDPAGNRRKIGFTLPDNIGLTDIIDDSGNIVEEGNVYTKEQIQNLLNSIIESINNIGLSLSDSTLSLIDNDGNTLSEVSFDINNINNLESSLNTITESIRKAGHEISLSDNALSLIDQDGNTLSEVYFEISNINNLENSLNTITENIRKAGYEISLSDSTLSLIDQDGNTLSDVYFEIENINHLSDNLSEKINKPYNVITTPTTDWKWLPLLNDSGDSVKMLAGDLGKNVANSELTSIAGAGLTLGANWTFNASGYYYYLTGLTDVSSDATYNTLLTQNSNGRVAKTNGKQAFLALPAQLTEAERTTWKTAINGGWTTNTMSVAIITPPVVDQEDKNYWLSMRGANLNLLSTSFSVEIVATDSTTVIATIPNSQVQLYTNGLDLVFYYNFKDVPIGQYKIRLWNGVAYYTTSLTITVVQQLQIVDISALIWTKEIYNDAINDATFGSGGSAIYQSSATVKAYSTADPTIVGALKSSKINDIGENFYLEFSVNFQHTYNTTSATQYVGLMNNNEIVDLLDQTLTKIKIVGVLGSSTGYRNYYLNNGIVGSNGAGGTGGANETINIVMIKNGTSMTIAVTARNITSLIVISAPDIEYSLNMAVNNMGSAATTSINIANLYKF